MLCTGAYSVLFNKAASGFAFVVVWVGERAGYNSDTDVYCTVVLLYVVFQDFEREAREILMGPAVVLHIVSAFRHFFYLLPCKPCGVGRIVSGGVYFGPVYEKCAAKTTFFQFRSGKCIMFGKAVIECVAYGTGFVVAVVCNFYCRAFTNSRCRVY